MIIALNILNLLFLLFFLKSPNKGLTSFQFIMGSIHMFIDPFIEHIYTDLANNVIFRSLFLVNFMLWFWIDGTSEITEKASYKAENKSNSISEPYIVLNFPWQKCDFSKVALNPKFIARYYELQQNEKSNFLEFITFTFLKEYFYFKSVISFYLVSKEIKNRKDY